MPGKEEKEIREMFESENLDGLVQQIARDQRRRIFASTTMDAPTRKRYQYLDENLDGIREQHFKALESGHADHVVLSGFMDREPIMGLMISGMGLEAYRLHMRSHGYDLDTANRPVVTGNVVVEREVAAQILETIAPGGGHGDSCRELPKPGKYTVVVFLDGFTTVEVPEAQVSGSNFIVYNTGAQT
jgi:hypothetical protein